MNATTDGQAGDVLHGLEGSTPGPWVVIGYPDERHVEIKTEDSFRLVATVYFNDGDRDANARLIAAAPTLYATVSALIADKARLEAEVARLRADAWQPIATAPKDAEAVLLYVVMPAGSEYAKAVGMPEGWSEVDLGEWSSQRRQWESVHFAGTPTHWMPRPAPPIDAALHPTAPSEVTK